MNATYITTHSGKFVDLANPQAETINFNDIAVALAREARFNGATSRMYSVAEHSLLVMHLTPAPYKIYGLLHDAHEAYIGDLTAPVYNILARNNDFRALNMLKNRLDAAIYKAARVEYPSLEAKQVVHAADMQALAIEWHLLMNPAKSPHQIPKITVPEPEIERIMALLPKDGWNIAGAFLEALEAIIGELQ